MQRSEVLHPLTEDCLKRRTFRVSLIPTNLTRHQFESYLGDLLDDIQSGRPQNTISLVPYGRFQTATVTFKCKEPSLFAKCKGAEDKTYWTIKETKTPLVVDCGFLGITPLYSAEQPTVE